jgi:hypothetical protein
LNIARNCIFPKMTIYDTKFLGDPGIATNEGLLQRLAV